jgi:RHS repeat-associated protein
MPTLNAAQPFTRVAVDSIQSVMLTLRATARSVGGAIAAKLGWRLRSALVGARATAQLGIVGTVGRVEKPSTPMRGRRWVSCVKPAYGLVIASGLVSSVGHANPLHRLLDFQGYCLSDCAANWVNATNDGVQKTKVFDSYEAAMESTVASYKLREGYTTNNNGIDTAEGITICGSASVTDAPPFGVPFQFNHPNYTQQWHGDLSFRHTCRAYNATGAFLSEFLSSPRSLAVQGTCKKGYIAYRDSSTGECAGPPESATCPDTAGNPIVISNAAKSASSVDVALAGGMFSFRTSYRSLYAFPPAASIGKNWTNTFESSVVFLPSATSTNIAIEVLRADGRAVRYRFVNSAWESFEKGSDSLVELKNTSNVRTGWKYYEASSENTELYNAAGVLQSITTRAGVVQTLAYNASNQLTTVTDSYGRTLTFAYNASTATLGANNIATVTDHLGNTVSYTYDAANNLATVTYPGGGIKTYLYNEPAYTANTNLPNAMTGIIDETGTRFATYQYDAQGRAISTEHAGGVEKYQLNYTSPYAQTIVTDPLGTQRTYNFQTILGVVKTTGVSQPCPSCGGSSSQATTYDINGNVASRTDFNNKKSCSAFDLTRNLETSRIDGLLATEDCTASLATPPARPDVRKTSTTWHATYRLPLTLTEPAAAATVGGAAGIKTTVFTYDTAGNVLTKKVTAPKNDGSAATELRTWTWTYNATGQVLTAKDPANKTTTTVYYAATDTAVPPKFTQGDAQTVTNAVGHVTTFNEYDKNGRLLKMTDANGLVTTMSYHPRGWLTSRAVNNGATTETTQYTYDNVGQLTRVTMPDGSTLNYAYDDAHRLVGMADLSTGASVAGNGSLRMQLANLTGNKIVYTLDAMGNRTGESNFDPTGSVQKTKTRIIDSLNRLQQDIGGTTYATAPTQAITQYGYDNNGNVTSTTDPLGRVTTHTYDALNRLVLVIDPYNGSAKPTNYTYDTANNLTRVTDPENKSTDYTYNGHNNLITQASPDTGATKFTYNAMGNVVTKFDAANRCSLTSYDNLHRATAIRYFAATNATTNTAAGCAAATTATATVEETHTTTYDSITATLGGPGGKGRVSRMSDAAGRVDYVYDLNGRITSKAQVTTGTTNTTKTVTYSYNASGQMTAMTTPSGQTLTYVYGAPTSGNPGKVTGIQVNGADLLKGSVYAPFGPNGGWTWGNSGATLGSTPPLNQHLRIFDKDYRPTAIASDPEGYNRNITWDQANRITGITVPGGANPTITLPGVSNAASLNQAFAYDQLDRLTTFNAGISGATNAATGLGLLPTETFTYDGIGNRKTRTTQAPGAIGGTGTQSTSYVHGTTNHWLQSSTGQTPNTYTLDVTGNTLTETNALAAMNPTTGQLNANTGTPITSALTYTFDAKNRLSKVQIGATTADTVTYKINAMGQRVQKTGAGVYAYSTTATINTTTGQSPQSISLNFNTRYVHDEQGRLLGEYSPEGKLIAETIWFNDLPVATLRPKGSSNQLPLGVAGTGAATANNAGNNTTANKVNVDIYYVHPDHLGTPRVVTRSVAFGGATTGPNAINKAVWSANTDSFGTSLGNSAPNENPQLVSGTATQVQAATFRLNHRFPGQVFDGESGKHYNYFRDYDPSVGRFPQSDPIGLRGGISTYGYVLQRPTTLTDPFGLETGPYHPPDGVKLRCTRFDTCPALRGKMFVLMRMIDSHEGWDRHVGPPGGGGRHSIEIGQLWEAYARCQSLYESKCKDKECNLSDGDKLGLGALGLGAICLINPLACGIGIGVGGILVPQ